MSAFLFAFINITIRTDL